MITKIAWKNIWRNRVRSLVLIVSTSIGVWSLIFLLSWVFGIVNTFINKSIDLRLGHIQIHHPEYGEEFNVQKSFDKAKVAKLEEVIGDHKYGERVVVQSMVKSARANRGLIIKGISPEQELKLSPLKEHLVEGNFFEKKVKNPLLLSTTVAEKLSVKVNNKVIANFQDAQGQLVAAAFRVVGIYETGDLKLDQLMAFGKIDDLRRLAGMDSTDIHEVVLKIPNLSDLEETQKSLQEYLPALNVQNYKEISPDIALFSTQIKLNVIIMTAIFMLALIFGIINTMLMAVLERFKELGMLMAIGMNKPRVFRMIVIETFLLTMVGVPIGLLLGWFTIDRLQINGIDLSNWSEGLRAFGLSHIVRPELEPGYYIFVAISVGVTAVLASIYPSLKAIKLNPVEALRKI